MDDVSPACLAKVVKEDAYINFLGRVEEMMNDVSDRSVFEIENFINSFEFTSEDQKCGLVELLLKMLENRPLVSETFVSIIKNFISKNPSDYKKLKFLNGNENFASYDFQRKFSNNRIFDSLISIIYKDDVDSLHEKVSEPGFDINIKLQINFLKNTLIDVAASVGAIKCFKYLYVNNAKLDSFNIPKCAILGGNSEIIHLVEQKGHKISQLEISEAIKGHHNEILDWLTEKFPHFENSKKFLVECAENMNIHGLMRVDEIDIGVIGRMNESNIISQTIIKYASKHTEFVEACRNGDIEVVNRYLSGNVDVNCEAFIRYKKSYKSPTYGLKIKINATFPLFEACIGGQTEVVQLLLADPRIDVNKKYKLFNYDHDEVGFSFPLLEAAARNHHEIVKLLLQHKDIDINKENEEPGYKAEFHTNPLIQAIHNNCTESALLLLEKDGIDINYEGYGMFEQSSNENQSYSDDEGGFSYPIIEAICNENAELVEKLLCFPNINLSAEDCIDPPFIHAVESGNIDIIKSFIDHGKADMDQVGGKYSEFRNYNALSIARKIRKPEVIELLKAYQATQIR